MLYALCFDIKSVNFFLVILHITNRLSVANNMEFQFNTEKTHHVWLYHPLATLKSESIAAAAANIIIRAIPLFSIFSFVVECNLLPFIFVVGAHDGNWW